VPSDLTRRDVLTTFLGASAALAACRRKETPHYGGELFGANFERGHRVRDDELRKRASAPDLPTTRVKIAIVGGGPSGLSALWRLVRGGLSNKDDIALFELEDVAGGTSRGGESALTRYPWGAHYVPVPSGEARALIALLDEMGVVEGKEADGTPIVAEQVLCRAPEERLFYRGIWYEGLYLTAGARTEDLAQLRAFRKEVTRFSARRDAQGRHAFVIPLSRASDDAEVLALDSISMRSWMDARGFTSKRLRWLVDYACRDDYGLSAETEDGASAWAGLFYFASRLGEGGRPAPLMTWPDGNGALVRHLASVAGERVRTGCTVIDVSSPSPSAGGVSIVMLDREGTMRRVIAERAIVATPRYVSRKIVADLRTIAPESEQKAFDYGAWAVANVHLDGRPAAQGVPFAWDNVLYESPSLGYVVATHQTGRDHGATVWTWYYAITDEGRVAREKLLGASWREWSDIAFSDLSRAHPDLVRHASKIDVFRWGHAMVRPRVGARAALAKIAPQAPKRAIHFAHTDLSGVALFEEAHDQGVRAAEEVLAAIGVPSPSIR